MSYVSQYVTLEPGRRDLHGDTADDRAIKDGDVVEVEVEGVGMLRNRSSRLVRSRLVQQHASRGSTLSYELKSCERVLSYCELR